MEASNPQQPGVPAATAVKAQSVKLPGLVMRLKQYWYLVLIPVVLLITIIVLGSNPLSNNASPSGTEPTPYKQDDTARTDVSITPSQNGGTAGDFPACDPVTDRLSVLPVEFSHVLYIAPLGNFNPQGGHVFPTEHIYLYLTKPASNNNNVAPYEVPLYAPADMWITMINGSEHRSESPVFIDYSLEFTVCNNYKGVFGHVTTISDTLAAALTAPYQQEDTYETGGKTYHMFRKELKIQVSAGEQLGTVGGRAGQNALDFSFYDMSKPAQVYANQSRWANNFKQLHAECAVDYFTPALKTQLESKLGNMLSGNLIARTVAPVCGLVDQDLPGTAQGIWLLKGAASQYPEDPNLTLAHSNFDPAVGVFSVGTSLGSIGLNVNIYQFTPQTSGTLNRDFPGVSADGNVYCYNLAPGFSGDQQKQNSNTTAVILEMPTATTLRIGKKTGECGTGPWSMGNYVEFER